MNELQIESAWECIAEIRHISKNTSGAASIAMADLAEYMERIVKPFDPEFSEKQEKR